MPSKIIKYLTQPYPRSGNKWRKAIFISVFIALFLLLFQPFGISEFHSRFKILFLIGFGIITFIVCILSIIVLPSIFKEFYNENKWTIAKEYLAIVFTILSIGIANYFYATAIFDFNSNINTFIHFLLFTISIGMFPVAAILIISQKIKYNTNFKNAQELQGFFDSNNPNKSSLGKITIVSESKNDDISVNPNNIIYICSEGNYISIFINDNNEVARKVIRCTIKSIEQQLQSINYVLKCHRAYLININKVVKVSGNAQGLKISLSNSTDIIPVSRTYVSTIKAQLPN